MVGEDIESRPWEHQKLRTEEKKTKFPVLEQSQALCSSRLAECETGVGRMVGRKARETG